MLFADLPEMRAPPKIMMPFIAHGSANPMGKAAHMAGRIEAAESLDFFPTPPWVTRCIIKEVLEPLGLVGGITAWEPAVGAGHCAGPMAEAGWRVHASDIAEYGWANMGGPMPRLGSFIDCQHGQALPVPNENIDIIFTNPPFVGSLAFAHRALSVAQRAVVLITRLAWLESIERYELRERYPLAVALNWAERVAMFRGRWDPVATSATAYAAMIWLRDPQSGLWSDGPDGLGSRIKTIAPGARKRFEKPYDLKRFAGSFQRYDTCI